MASNKAIRIGLMPPLSGLVSMYGQEIIHAAEIACQEINENGGVLGRPLELIVEDDGSLPESSVLAAKRLLEQFQCSALVGNLMSNSRIAVAYRVAEPQRIPYLNFSFYEGSILSRYFFHFAALPNQQIEKMIPYMKQLHGPRMYFCGNNYEWPRGSIDAAKRTLAQAQGEVCGEEYHSIGIRTEEIEALLDRISDSDTDVLVPYFAGTDQINFLTHFSQRGLKQKMAVVMGHYDEVMASRLPEEVREGFYSCNTYFMSVDTPESRNYLERLSLLPGVDGIWPNGNGFLTNFGEGAYLCVKAFALAANRARTLDPETVISILETVALRGPQGPVQMDPATHHARVNTYLSSSNADGTFEIIKKFGPIEPVIPIRYRHLHVAQNPALEENIRLQARIVEQMSEAVYMVNADDATIAYVNPGLERIFGYEKAELLGKPAVLLSSAPPEDTAEINSTLYQKGTWTGERLSLRKDGSQFWGMVSMSAFTHAQFGEVWLAILHDISDRKHLEEDLKKYGKELEKRVKAMEQEIAERKRLEAKLRGISEELFRSNADLEQYAYIASHDLKEPLRMVKNYTGLLALRYQGKLDAKADKYIGYIGEGVTRMMQLVNDLHIYASAGRGELETEQVEVAQVVQAALSNLQMPIRKSHAQITVESLPEISTSPGLLLQVFQNLIDNAVKFRREGVIPQIRISAKPSTDDASLWIFSVEDNGIGIDPQFSNRIFVMFQRLNERTKYPGTGIGLAICKRIIERHHGKIWFESKPGQGSTFYFSLPQKTERSLRSLQAG